MFLIILVIVVFVMQIALISYFRRNIEQASLKGGYEIVTSILIACLCWVIRLILFIMPIFVDVRHFPFWLVLIGIITMITGLFICIVASAEIGRFATNALKFVSDHQLVKSGLYKYIRHPIYTGNILLFMGASITLSNMYVIIVVMCVLVPAYVYRIKIEEEMLLSTFKDEYRDYMRKTKKLIPFVF